METRGKAVETLAYAAGVVDSDGHIGISHKNPTPRVVELTRRVNPSYVGSVTVTNTSRELMDWFIGNFGGYVKTRKKVLEHHKTTYSWNVSELKAAEFLRQILPYLRVKTEQAKLVIELKERWEYPNRLGVRRDAKGHIASALISSTELARRDGLYQQAKVLNDDRRPQRLSGVASRTDEAIVCANGKPLEGEGTETISPGQLAKVV